MAWVYLLECRDGSFYVGSTIDLERRVSDHQLGLGAAYTRHRRPVRLVWAAAYDRIDEAFAFEKRVQGWNRAKRLALIEGRFDDLPGLASRARRPEAPGGGFETLAQGLAPPPPDEPAERAPASASKPPRRPRFR
jgi:putative endonuclease